jgi:hypothetical protein
VIVNRLTVDGRDYFLPEPVLELKNRILSAIKDGGGYVLIPPLRSGSGIEILFSPGMPVLWTKLDVGGEQDDDADQHDNAQQSDLELGMDDLGLGLGLGLETDL